MVKRTRIEHRRSKSQSNFYFADNSAVDFIPSGCTVLDLVLGNGWALGEVVNLVGDRSSGKTLMAIEACANFARSYGGGAIAYDVCGGETFDLTYAQYLGLPVDNVELNESETVEGFYDSLDKFLKTNSGGPSVYVLDSLDALSDKAEMERKIDDGSYGTKAKKVGEVFRRLSKRLRKNRCMLLVVSQIRDNIGVTFGKKHKRSGGKALDFYAAQVVWLSELKKISKQVKGVKRPIGIMVKAKAEKNKVGLPFRECQYPIIFNYGMDDDQANLDFLKSVNASVPKSEKKIADKVRKEWMAVEDVFAPTKRKYD